MAVEHRRRGVRRLVGAGVAADAAAVPAALRPSRPQCARAAEEKIPSCSLTRLNYTDPRLSLGRVWAFSFRSLLLLRVVEPSCTPPVCTFFPPTAYLVPIRNKNRDPLRGRRWRLETPANLLRCSHAGAL
eukprot:scaffold11685_cov55-Phaeocystis_antarctica.AAC.1